MGAVVDVETFGDCRGCGGPSSRERPLASIHCRTPLGYTVVWAHEGCEEAAVASISEQPARPWKPKLTLSEMIARKKVQA
jgi:hypothetical protein